VKKNAKRELQGESVSWTYAQRGISKIITEGRSPNIFVIDETSTLENAKILEKLYICEYRKADYKLWNLTKGGDGTSGLKWSNDSRIKFSTTLKKVWRENPERRAKMGNAQKGNEHLAGHVHSDETRVKMSISQKGIFSRPGYKHSDNTRAKMSASHSGKHLSTKIVMERLKVQIAKMQRELENIN